MKKLSLLASALLILLYACDTSNVKLFPSMSESAVANIQHQGDYNETAIYNVSEVKNTIDELDAEGKVTDVMIEGLHVDIVLDTDADYPITTATSTTADLILTGWDDIDYPLAENISIDLSKGDQTVNLYDSLDSEGVNQLKEMLFDIATNSVPMGETIVTVTLVGIADPYNSYINATATVVIDLSIEFTPD